MEITKQMLNGEIPVTEEQLRFLAKNHEQYDLTRLNVSNISNFSAIFSHQNTFNQPIGNWNVSNGIKFEGMFYKSSLFNQDIGKWDVSEGINFCYMFDNAESFNQNISQWDMSKGMVFYSMFRGATQFRGDISGCNISSFRFDELSNDNFYLSIQKSYNKIGFTPNAEQLQMLYKECPNCPLPSDFDYSQENLYLIESNGFYGFLSVSDYGFLTTDHTAYEIFTDRISINELIDACDIELYYNREFV